MDKLKKAKWLSEFYAAVADGGQMQAGEDDDWCTAHSGPDLYSDPKLWRIKPKQREFVGLVCRSVAGALIIGMPLDWQSGTRVRVTEILEEED